MRYHEKLVHEAVSFIQDKDYHGFSFPAIVSSDHFGSSAENSS